MLSVVLRKETIGSVTHVFTGAQKKGKETIYTENLFLTSYWNLNQNSAKDIGNTSDQRS